jgi:hypothetical protein
LLIGKEIKSVDDAWEAIEHFHKKGCPTVVLSSTDLGDDKNLLALASSRIGKSVPSVFIIAKILLYVCLPRQKKRLKRENTFLGLRINAEDGPYGWQERKRKRQVRKCGHCITVLVFCFNLFSYLKGNRKLHFMIRNKRVFECVLKTTADCWVYTFRNEYRE